MRKHHDRRAVRLVLQVGLEPRELLGAKVAQAAALQINDVDETDEVDAVIVIAVPAGALRTLAVAFQIGFAALFIDDVVLAGHKVNLYAGLAEHLVGIAFTLATASRSVPSASGFAALSKPMWLSLICRNVNPVDSAASASPINPTEWGTPPLTAQSTPVPAQTMHSSTSRRPSPCPRSSKPFLAMSHLPVGQTAPNGAAKQETRPFRALFPKNIQFLDL